MDLNTYYYAYLLREMARAGYIQSLYRGIRERSSDFRFDVFAELFLPVPPREEKDQIVSFLDWKVSQINRFLLNVQGRTTIDPKLVEMTPRPLLGLLGEYRTRLISDVVTGKKVVQNVVVPEYEAVSVVSDTIENDVLTGDDEE